MDPTGEIGFDAGKERKLSGEAKLRKCPGDLVELRVCQFFGQKKKTQMEIDGVARNCRWRKERMERLDLSRCQVDALPK